MRTGRSRSFAVSLLMVFFSAATSCATGAADPDRFGILVSNADGKNVRRILSDPTREINHARVAPDKNWITFTRYNKKGWNGIAKEENNYEESEIMLMRLDGSELQSLVPPRKGKIAANGYWTEDGKAIVYVSNDNAANQGQINRIDIATRRITKVELPGNLWASDPHLVGNQLAISVFNPKEKRMSTWIHDLASGKARQLTSPVLGPGERAPPMPHGDYDPKISPDGSRVVVMRLMGKDNWHMVVIDLKTGAERDLSSPKAVDGVPEWSSDGRKLIFWHVNLADLKQSGLYTVSPDGRDRQRIPLPRGYFYTMPAFFPGEGSGPESRIIFSAEKNPQL